MFVIGVKIKNVELLVLVISFLCFTNARQIRYSRYNTEVLEDGNDNQNSTRVAGNQIVDNDIEIQATVREIKSTPHSVIGFRPSKTFSDSATQPVRNNTEAQVTDETPIVSTTETMDFTTTTQGDESETTTVNNMETNHFNEKAGSEIRGRKNLLVENDLSGARYPPSGFRPKIPFSLPVHHLLKNEQQQETVDKYSNKPVKNITKLFSKTDIQTPYQPADFRPTKVFLWSLENIKTKNGEDFNSKHPICGSRNNPLASKPLNVKNEDLNSESIFVNSQSLDKSQQQQRALIIPINLTLHPRLFTRPPVYNAPL